MSIARIISVLPAELEAMAGTIAVESTGRVGTAFMVCSRESA